MSIDFKGLTDLLLGGITDLSNLGVGDFPCFLVCKMQIKDAINLYLTAIEGEGISQNTIKDKTRHLALFSRIKKQVEDVTLEDIYTFVNELPTTDIRKWRIKIDLRAFFRFLNEHHLSDLTYTLIRNKEPELGIRPHLTEEEFKKMDEVCHELLKIDDRRYIRWHAIHHFLYETGLRRTELCHVPFQSFDNENRTFIVTTAKTHKPRRGFFHSDLENYLKEYKPKERLFEINHRELEHIITTLRNKAGIARHITPHSYRHAFCTRLLTNGCPIQQTALLAGHQRVSTTMRYYHEVDLRGAYEQFINPPKTLEIKSKVGLKTKYCVKLQITKNK